MDRAVSEKKHIHLIGIGGVGISWIAEMLLADGHNVSGSDLKASPLTKHLEALGATVHIGHDKRWVIGADVVVHTFAVGEDHIELQSARSLDIPILTRAEMQGKLMKSYQTSVAVSGAHGKSTTTSMIASILSASDKDPTLLVGAHLDTLGGNAHIGHGDILVMEACEYRDSFLFFKPTYGLILNIDEDHLDYFSGMEHITSSFLTFANGVSEKGGVFVNIDDIPSQKLIKKIDRPIITIGKHGAADYQAKNIAFDKFGKPQYDVFFQSEVLFRCHLSVPGTHSIDNSLFAIAFCHHIGVDIQTIKNALLTFKNPSRRFESIGTFCGVPVIDDYAHHPTEIEATLCAARQIHKGRIVCVFQPHTYTRTQALFDKFSKAFHNADEVIAVDIYAAREVNKYNVSSQDLTKSIQKQGKKASHMPSFEALKDYLSTSLSSDDLLIMMGAGSISDWAHNLIKPL